MSKPINSEEDASRLMNSCGKSFLAYWLEPIIENFHTLDSDRKRAMKSFVRDCHQSGLGFNPVSTRATGGRVSNALRLIEWGYARYALECIATSERSEADVASRAKATLRRLDSGDLKLPY